MIFNVPEALLLLPLAFIVTIVLWRRNRSAVREVAVAVRLLILLLLVLALAQPARKVPEIRQQRTIVLIDQSDSLGAEGRRELLERGQQLAEQHDAQILLFSGVVGVEGAAPRSGDATDLEGALRAGGELLGPGGRIILLSDGLQTTGDALRALAALPAETTIDTLAYTPAQAAELLLLGLELPPRLRIGEPYSVVARIYSSEAATATLTMRQDGRAIVTETLTLPAGITERSFDGQAEVEGVLRMQATLSGRPDTSPENNTAAATALVTPRPDILLVEAQTGSSTALREQLLGQGLQVRTSAPRDVPTHLPTLRDYDGVVLFDVPASALNTSQMASLREFVRSEGRGLIVLGGDSSLTLGSYKDTPLEEALPVQMEPPPRPERAPVALLLIIDRSASMYGDKLDMAKNAAVLSAEALAAEDVIGVLTYDTQNVWAVNFQQVGVGAERAQLQEEILNIGYGGGTNIIGALQAGLPALAQQPVGSKHAILLTDGRTYGDDADYQRAVDAARAEGITLSTIAIGKDADLALLQRLAELGSGRYHFAASAADIPRLTLLESELASADPRIEGQVDVLQSQAHPILRRLDLGDAPQLSGYVGTTLKEQAELVLHSSENDPLLAVWQYGLGRAVVWTPGAGPPWGADWQSWTGSGAFWGQIIRYALPEPDSGLVQVSTRRTAAGIELIVDAAEPSGAPRDLSPVRAVISLPDGSTTEVPLTQVAPGRYSREVVPPGPGPYAVSASISQEPAIERAQAGFTVAPPAEYLPGGDGSALLALLSERTGGTTDALTPLAEPEPPPDPGSAPLWPWLLLAAALLWPLEIALRRGWI